MPRIGADEEIFKRKRREKAPLPSPADVLYVKPAPGSAGRKCGNCIMWSKDLRCSIHKKDLVITSQMVCGYYVFGPPMKKRMDHPGMQAVDENYSGLIKGPREGTKCNNCMWYTRGRCLAVEDPKTQSPAKVHRDGCCSRWAAG